MGPAALSRAGKIWTDDFCQTYGIDMRCFNSTTNRNKVYIELSESKRKLEVDRLFDMWSYLYNRAIRIMRHIGLIDRFGRTCKPIDEHSLETLCAKKGIEPTSWRDFILTIAFDPKNLPEWTKLYPRSMLECVAEQLAQQLPNSNLVETGTELMTLDISIGALRADLKETKFWMDTGDNSNVLELDMVNQYGNPVSFIIKSNSIKAYDYMEALSKHLNQIGDSLRIILQYMPDRSKILCTFRCNIEEEKPE